MPTLLAIVAQLSAYDPEHAIYAMKPWHPGSLAEVVGLAAPDGPQAPVPEGFDRFVDIADALDFFSGGWADDLDPEARCGRLVQYATYDR